MDKEIVDIIPKEFKKFEIINIKSEASKRKYYRLKKGERRAILMDSLKEPKQFENFLKVHKIISNTKISIPKIYDINPTVNMNLQDLELTNSIFGLVKLLTYN